MTLKLTSDQAQALFNVFNHFVVPEVTIEPTEILVLKILKRVYVKLRAKLEARKKDGYSLSLTDEEALAYYIYFKDRQLPAWDYEQIFIGSHVAEINKQII